MLGCKDLRCARVEHIGYVYGLGAEICQKALEELSELEDGDDSDIMPIVSLVARDVTYNASDTDLLEVLEENGYSIERLWETFCESDAYDDWLEELCEAVREDYVPAKTSAAKNLTWNDYYDLFQIIVDEYFPDEQLISQQVNDLYSIFKNQPEMREAYDRWINSDMDEYK